MGTEIKAKGPYSGFESFPDGSPANRKVAKPGCPNPCNIINEDIAQTMRYTEE